MRLLLLPFAAALLFAQQPQPASVSIFTPAPRLIAGQKLNLQATARDRGGNVMGWDVFEWRSGDDNIATVTDAGEVTALRPGYVAIQAQAANIRGIVQLQVLPARLEISPAQPDLVVGQEVQFTARAFDIFNQPIPNLPFVWSVVSAQGFQTNSATISRGTGLLLAQGPASIMVRAAFEYRGSSSAFLPAYYGVTSLTIRMPTAYRWRRLLSSEESRSSFRLSHASSSWIHPTPDGGIAFLGDLDGLTNAVLFAGADGRLSVPISGGKSTAQPGGILAEFNPNFSLNAAGEALASANGFGQYGTMGVATRATWRPTVNHGTSVRGLNDIRNFTMFPFSYNDAGMALFRAQFRFDESIAYNTGLLRHFGNRIDVEISDADRLPEWTGAFTFEQAALDATGNLAFVVSGGGRQGLYYKPAGLDAIPLVRTRQVILGSPVSNFFGSVAFTPAGELVGFAVLDNGTHVVFRWPPGVANTTPETLAAGWINGGILYPGPAGVAFWGSTSEGTGAHLWPPKARAAQLLIASTRQAPSGEPFTPRMIAVNAKGELFLAVRTPTASFLVARLAGSEWKTIVRTGDLVDAPQPLAPLGLVPGNSAGPLYVQMGDRNSNVFQSLERGLAPVLVNGDRVGANAVGSLRGPVAAPNGDLLALSNAGLVRVTARGPEIVAPESWSEPGGLTIRFGSWGNRLGGNSAGAIAAMHDTTANGAVFLHDKGARRLIAAANNDRTAATALPNGGFVRSLSGTPAIDERGRVAFIADNGSGQSTLVGWENGTLRVLLAAGESLAGERVTRIENCRAAGDAFYCLVRRESNTNVIARWRDGVWSPLLAPGQDLPDSNVVNNIGQFAVNSKGEIAALVSPQFDEQKIVVLLPDRIVEAWYRPLPVAGDYLFNLIRFELRDDRRLVMMGIDIFDRMNVYVAEPQF